MTRHEYYLNVLDGKTLYGQAFEFLLFKIKIDEKIDIDYVKYINKLELHITRDINKCLSECVIDILNVIKCDYVIDFNIINAIKYYYKSINYLMTKL